MPSDRDLTTGTVPRRLFQMGWPMTIGIMATMSVPIADAYFLGRLGTAQLAAISYSFPVVLTLMSLAIGLGSGTASVVSRAVGELKKSGGGEGKVRQVSTDAVVLSAIVVTALAIVGWFAARPVFALLGASGGTLDMVVAYMRIWFFGMPALGLMMVGSNLLRANGDAKSVSVIMILSAVVNVALDPLLIFGWGPIPALGIEGAAWATLGSRVGAVAAAFYLIVHRDRLVNLALCTWEQTRTSWAAIGRIAVPSAVGNAINPLGITVVTGVLATYGDEVVAGFGTATRIESFAAIPMLALSSAIGPVAGQNFGADEDARVTRAHRDSFVFSLGWSLLMAAVLWFAAPWLATFFTEDQSVIDPIVSYLRIVPITLFGYGVVVVAAGGLNAVGEPWYGLAVYALRTVALYVPLAFVAAQFAPLWGVFAGIAVANVVSGALVWWWTLRYFRTHTAGDASKGVAEGVPQPAG